MEQREKVILFGRGMVYQRKKETLHEKYEVVLFLDNAVDRGQLPVREEGGIYVANPADIRLYPDLPVILLSYAPGDMYRQLTGLGVSENRIRFGPELEPYNSFERMLFGSGGKLVPEDGELFYCHEGLQLHIKTDPSSLETLAGKLRGTPLYPDAGGILKELPLQPLDDAYGMNRGTPVDRYYIEQFLAAHRDVVRGTVMEVGDRFYTEKFGGDRVTCSVILHVEKENPKINQIKGNFATGEGLEEESVDCLICTQTLPFIYDLHSAAGHMVKILKKGGYALVTAAGLSQTIQYEKAHYGHFWGLTDMSLEKLFLDRPEVESVGTITFGNVKTVSAFLYGISSEELSQEELDFRDPDYQLIVAAVVKRR